MLEFFQPLCRPDKRAQRETQHPVILMVMTKKATIEKVWESLKQTDSLKAVGHDGVNPAIAKPLVHFMAKPFTQLALLDKGRLPAD